MALDPVLVRQLRVRNIPHSKALVGLLCLAPSDVVWVYNNGRRGVKSMSWHAPAALRAGVPTVLVLLWLALHTACCVSVWWCVAYTTGVSSAEINIGPSTSTPRFSSCGTWAAGNSAASRSALVCSAICCYNAATRPPISTVHSAAQCCDIHHDHCTTHCGCPPYCSGRARQCAFCWLPDERPPQDARCLRRVHPHAQFLRSELPDGHLHSLGSGYRAIARMALMGDSGGCGLETSDLRHGWTRQLSWRLYVHVPRLRAHGWSSELPSGHLR